MYNKERVIEVLSEISKDMERDVENFDGKPFTGLTVGTQFGNQAAAIASLADILKETIESISRFNENF